MFIEQSFNSNKGRAFIKDALDIFQEFIHWLEEIYNVRPFNQQSVGSLLEMFLLTLTTQPKTVIEIGTGTRSSTLALALATEQLPAHCIIYGINIAPSDFKNLTKAYFPEYKFGQVVDITMDLADFDVPDEWERPILMLYDAHDDDIPGVVISEHAVRNWFPKLRGQVIMVHDCSVYPADLQLEIPSTHTSVVHFSGRRVIGFHEVDTLVAWLNDMIINFYRPGDELVAMGFEELSSSLIYFTLPKGPYPQMTKMAATPKSQPRIEESFSTAGTLPGSEYMLTPAQMGTEMIIAIRGRCNYSCSYCVAKNFKEDVSLYTQPSLEAIYDKLDSFVVTTLECGGSEPTIHPQIRDILELALRHGPVSVPTNNSLPPAKWLPQVNPRNMLVRAALHPQGEKHLDAFLNRLLQIRETGADIRVVFVAHPARIEDVERYVDLFQEKNILMEITPFVGEWEGKQYLYSYTQEERDRLYISEDSYWYTRLSSETSIRDFSGIPCLAGYRSFYIDPQGEFHRCLYDSLVLKEPLKKAAPCRVDYCGCGLLLEKLSTLGDARYWNHYWRGMARLPALTVDDPRAPEEIYQDLQAIYWDLMKRYRKVSPSAFSPGTENIRQILHADTALLRNILERYLYGEVSGREIVQSGPLLLFAPTNSRDHLATPFYPVSFDEENANDGGMLEINFTSAHNQQGCTTITVQNQNFTTLAELRSNSTGALLRTRFGLTHGGTKAIRLVFRCERNQRCFLPDETTLSQVG